MKKRLLAAWLLLCLLPTGCKNNEIPKPPHTTVLTDTQIPTRQPSKSTAESQTDVPPAVQLPASHKEQFAPDCEGIYNYCPSVMECAGGTRYIYYCTNQSPYEVIDHIGCRKGTENDDGSYTWGEERIVLSPSDGGWDSHHVCDPSVIAGSFSYQGEHYSHLMAYLGCTSYDNQENKIGLALARSPEGPFVRVGDTPLIDFCRDPEFSGFQWGVGQPSLIDVTQNGSILLFYTKGDRDGTRLMVDEWVLSDLDAPVCKRTEEVATAYLYDLNGNQDHLNNVDLAYDAANQAYYAVSDCHPNPTDEPSFISSHIRVTHFKQKSSFEKVGWWEDATLGQAETGAPRNHNAAIVRNEYGHLPQTEYLTLYYTVSVTGGASLWSYRIHNCHIALR